MKDLKKRWMLALIVFAAAVALPPVSRAPARQGPDVVGRISFVDGQLLRYVPEIKDWVLVRQYSPFGLNDALYSGDSAKAEFIFPNGLLARIDAGTQIQLIAMGEDASEMDVASGIARLYNKNPDGMLKVTTPYGYVLARPNSIFDLYVGDDSVQVIALNGRVDYVQQSHNSSYELTPDGPAIVADASRVSNGEASVDSEWDDWNGQRDSLLAQRIEEAENGQSRRYLPPQLDYDAHDLDQSGRWEQVRYQGEYRQFWRPTGVPDKWQPFTHGRWTDYYGDQVWVPEESFGYVTSHYGNWILVDGGWYWAPPARPGVGASGPNPAFGWYPGRVAWIGAGEDIGWIPLAPGEPYYAHHHWGDAVIVDRTNPAAIATGSLAFAAAAVIVPRRDFYSVNNYSSVRITNINKATIINEYHAAPVVNNTVFKNYAAESNRYNFVNKAPTVKPYVAVDKRIMHNNQVASSAARNLTAPALKQAAASAKRAKPLSDGAVKPPAKLTSKLVPASQAKAPANSVKFKTLEMKTRTKPAKSSPATRPETARTPAHPVAPPHPATQPAPGVKHPPAPPAGMHPPATPPPFSKPPGHPPVGPPPSPKPGVHPPVTHPGTPKPGVHPPTIHNGAQKPAPHEAPPVQHHATPPPAVRTPAHPASPPQGARPPARHNAPPKPAPHPPAVQHHGQPAPAAHPAPPMHVPAPHAPAAGHPETQDKKHHPEH